MINYSQADFQRKFIHLYNYCSRNNAAYTLHAVTSRLHILKFLVSSGSES